MNHQAIRRRRAIIRQPFHQVNEDGYEAAYNNVAGMQRSGMQVFCSIFAPKDLRSMPATTV
jgi:hypothetical protein